MHTLQGAIGSPSLRLIDLPSPILGLIYSKLDDPEDRSNFLATSREIFCADDVRAQISRLEVLTCEDEPEEVAPLAVACTPAGSVLRHLITTVQGLLSIGRFSAGRRGIVGLETLELRQDPHWEGLTRKEVFDASHAKLDPLPLEKVPELIISSCPKLHSLVIKQGYHASVLKRLISPLVHAPQLRELSLFVDASLVGLPPSELADELADELDESTPIVEFCRAVGSLGTLEHLSMQFIEGLRVDLMDFGGLRNLRSLSVRGLQPGSGLLHRQFQRFLDACPQLTSLHFHSVDLSYMDECGPGELVSSTRVRSLHLEGNLEGFKWLRRANFPCLQALVLGTVNVTREALPLFESTGGDLGLAAAILGGYPQAHFSSAGCLVFESEVAFPLEPQVVSIIPLSGSSAARSLQAIYIRNCHITVFALSLLCSMFPSVTAVTITEDCTMEDESSCAMSLVHALPCLSRLAIGVVSGAGKGSFITAVRTAAQRRHRPRIWLVSPTCDVFLNE